MHVWRACDVHVFAIGFLFTSQMIEQRSMIVYRIWGSKGRGLWEEM